MIRILHIDLIRNNRKEGIIEPDYISAASPVSVKGAGDKPLAVNAFLKITQGMPVTVSPPVN